MSFLGIFRTIDMFCHFHSRYSGITQEQFINILILLLADSGIFGTLAYSGT